MAISTLLRDAGMGPVANGRPLPLTPAGATIINDGASLLETDEGGAVFLFGMASWCFEPDDVLGRRLAAVQLVETGAASPTQVAAAFSIDFETLRQWRQRWRAAGIEGLVQQRPGPKPCLSS